MDKRQDVSRGAFSCFVMPASGMTVTVKIYLLGKGCIFMPRGAAQGIWAA